MVAPYERTFAAKRGDKPAPVKKDAEKVEGKEAGKTGTVTDKPGAKQAAEQQVV